MSYLKALGVFRLVAEQTDPDARLSWQNGIACLLTKLSRDELTTFFLESYGPTPIVAPWNGGSGFYGGGSGPFESIASATVNRLDKLRLIAGWKPALRNAVRGYTYFDEVVARPVFRVDKVRVLETCRVFESIRFDPYLLTIAPDEEAALD